MIQLVLAFLVSVGFASTTVVSGGGVARPGFFCRECTERAKQRALVRGAKPVKSSILAPSKETPKAKPQKQAQ